MIGNRIKEIRNSLGLNQIEFGKKLNLSQSAIANYEKDIRTPIDAVIGSICREFHVNETWLRTGEGEMFVRLDPEDELMEWAGRVLAQRPEYFQKRFVKMLMGLSDNEWKLLEKKVLELAGMEKED